jgi:ABC-type polysaccharide/polyol phosphate export permease
MMGMMERLRELVARRDLLYMITWREITVKYKQSVMGLLWAVLMPIVVIGAGLVVRLVFARLSGVALTSSDVAMVATKAVPWSFFVAALRFGTTSLITNPSLVTKIYMPRIVFPIAAIGSQLLDFAVASTVTVILLAVLGVGASIQLLWLPVLVLLLVLLAAGFAILLAAAALFYRDFRYVVEVLLTFAIFFTPVFFEASLLGRAAPLVMLNPVAPIIEGFGAVVVRHQTPQLLWLLYSAGVTIVLLLTALRSFWHFEPLFAESI